MSQAAASIGLAVSAHHLHDYQNAADLGRDTLRLYQEISDKLGCSRCFETLAMVAEARGQPERAARLSGAAEALRAALGAPMPPVKRPDYEHSLAALRAVLSEEALAAAWTEGRAMTFEQAIEHALSEAPEGTS